MMAILYLALPLPRLLWPIPDPRLFIFIVVPATLILFLFPSLVYFVLRPLRKNILERRQVEKALHRDITEREKTEAELRFSRQQLRELSSHLQTALEEERTRIAREIHDELGQVLATLALDIHLLEGELPLRQIKARRKATAMARLIDSTIKTVQRVSAELRPVMLDDLGLSAAIQWQVREFEKRTGIACEIRLSLDGEGPDRNRSTDLFRILQEALTNILRHAQATRVVVHLRETEDRFILQVSDNGQGITRQKIADGTSLGLLGIRERAANWGGKVEIRGLPQRGTSLKVSLPWRPEPECESTVEFVEYVGNSGDSAPQEQKAAS